MARLLLGLVVGGMYPVARSLEAESTSSVVEIYDYRKVMTLQRALQDQFRLREECGDRWEAISARCSYGTQMILAPGEVDLETWGDEQECHPAGCIVIDEGEVEYLLSIKVRRAGCYEASPGPYIRRDVRDLLGSQTFDKRHTESSESNIPLLSPQGKRSYFHGLVVRTAFLVHVLLSTPSREGTRDYDSCPCLS